MGEEGAGMKLVISGESLREDTFYSHIRGIHFHDELEVGDQASGESGQK